MLSTASSAAASLLYCTLLILDRGRGRRDRLFMMFFAVSNCILDVSEHCNFLQKGEQKRSKKNKSHIARNSKKRIDHTLSDLSPNTSGYSQASAQSMAGNCFNPDHQRREPLWNLCIDLAAPNGKSSSSTTLCFHPRNLIQLR